MVGWDGEIEQEMGGSIGGMEGWHPRFEDLYFLSFFIKSDLVNFNEYVLYSLID